MATLYVTEFQYIASMGGYVQAAQAPPVATNNVAIGGASVQSAAFNANTKLIRVHADSTCSIEIGGTNPTATTSSMRMAAGTTEYFGVVSGAKLAVIANT